MLQSQLYKGYTHSIKVAVLTTAAFTIIACGSESTSPPNDSQPASDPATDTISTEVPGAFHTTPIGDVLVFGPLNRTLYTFDNDADGVSNCNDNCAEIWPPIAAQTQQNTGDFSTIERSDSSLQWAYKGSPLYYYQGDAAQGEVNGEGIGDVWFVARPTPISTGDTTLGPVLTARGSVNSGPSDAVQRLEYDGRTLYVFANDTANASNCADGCAASWPPLFADAAAIATGDYSIITRSDNTAQWAYQTQPLYFFAGDNAPGDTTGEGVGGVWSVASP